MLLGVDGHIYHGEFKDVPEIDMVDRDSARDALPYQSELSF